MNYSIGLSALRASQFSIDIVSQNLANANTVGYHRQRVLLATRPPQLVGGQYIGSGVDVSRIDRIRNQVIESTLTNSISDLRNIQQRFSIEGQIESLFRSGDGSIHEALGGFFDELSRLSANPSEKVQRNAAIQQGVDLAKQARDISSRLTNLKLNVKSQIEIEVDVLNKEIAELVALQHRIETASANQVVPNDLYDQRDQLINRIAEKIDIQRFENVQGGFGLTLANSSISLGPVPVEFKTSIGTDGTVSIKLKGTEREIGFSSGSISSLTEAYNHTIDQFQSKLNEFTGALIREIDHAHAQGVGINGPYTVLRSSRRFEAADVPLNEAGLAFPVSAGELYISVTDPAGEKRTHSISINPATDSLTDIANRISAIGNVQGVVDGQNGQLSIIATPGFRFDFTGNLETIPNLATYSGSATPKNSGQYEGDLNRQLSVAIVGSGMVGKTPGLTAQVTDLNSGKIIGEFNIGEGYEAGSPIKITEGVLLTFAGGDVAAGDSFVTSLVANSDRSGILSSLGLNNFFTGNDATNIGVSRRIVENPNELATSRSGDIGDTNNLAAIVQLRGSNLVGENRLTFEDYLGETTAEIGFQVKTTQLLEQNISELNYQYESEIASISGVDLNEEITRLSQYQKQYEAAVQVMRTIDNMLTELFSLVR